MGYSQSNFIESEGAVNLNNPFAAAYLYNSYERIKNPETGKYETPATGINVFERTENQSNKNDEIKGIGNAYAEYEIFKGLTVKSLFGIDYRSRTFDRLISPLSTAGSASVGGQGSLNQASNRRVKLINTNTANLVRSFGDRHYVNFVLGNETLTEKFRSTTYTGYGIDPKRPVAAGITQGTTTNGFIPAVGGSQTENALVSYFGNGTYTLDGRYNFSAGLRRDGSSKFGANNKWATFYSLGAGWNISDENFMKGLEFVNDLKLRVSYGTSGNQDLGTNADFPSLGLFGTSTYEGIAGIAPLSPENPDLKWEKSNKFNIGLDYSVLDRRVYGSLDVYNNITTDLFINTQLSRTSGFTSLQRNVGEMRNRGIELAINTDIIRGADFNWTTTLNIAYNDNEILDLFQEREFELGTSIVREGLPLGSHFIPTWAGVNPANGDPLYYDLEGNVTNVFSDDLAQPQGTFNPPVTGGFNSTVSYKGLELSTFFSFVQGNQLFNNNTFFITNPNFASFNQSKDMLNIWKTPGQVTDIQRLGTERQFSSKDLEDGSYLRFRNATLAYNVPQEMVSKLKLGSVRAFVQAQNLFTLTKFTGFDPELDNNIQQFDYPVPRTYTVGFDIGF
jgi:TonB-linked SusC/RagA family outer membrane protein